MAIINCPECGKEVSDKAKVCIHCGYPLEEMNSAKYKCSINENIYDLKESLYLMERGKYKEAFLGIKNSIGEISIKNCLNILEYMDIAGEVPATYHIKEYTKEIEKEAAQKILIMKDAVKVSKDGDIICPKCGSTQIQVVSRKWSLFTGVLTNKIDRVCLKCKNKF